MSSLFLHVHPNPSNHSKPNSCPTSSIWCSPIQPFMSSVSLALAGITWANTRSHIFYFLPFFLTYTTTWFKSSEDRVQVLYSLGHSSCAYHRIYILLILLVWKEKILTPSCSVSFRYIFPNLFNCNWDLTSGLVKFKPWFPVNTPYFHEKFDLPEGEIT